MTNQALNTFFTFYKKEGLVKTIKKSFFYIWYDYFHFAEYVLHFCSKDIKPIDLRLSDRYSVHMVNEKHPFGSHLKQYLHKYGKYRSEEYVLNKFHERIKLGADLWFIIFDGEIANTQWVIRGGFIKPFYFPLFIDDIVLFDTFTFKNFRRQGLNRLVLMKILNYYTEHGASNFYLTIKTWNIASIKSAMNANFKTIGKISRFNLFGSQMLLWHQKYKQRRL